MTTAASPGPSAAVDAAIASAASKAIAWRGCRCRCLKKRSPSVLRLRKLAVPLRQTTPGEGKRVTLFLAKEKPIQEK